MFLNINNQITLCRFFFLSSENTEIFFQIFTDIIDGWNFSEKMLSSTIRIAMSFTIDT